MNLPKYWPVAILFAAVLIYFWIDGEETVPSKPVGQEKISVAPPPAVSSWSAPRAQVYPGQNDAYQYQAPTSGNYRFRTDNDLSSRSKNEVNPYTSPDAGYQSYSDPSLYQSPNDATTYRFRPVDKNRQSKRWVGNYAQKPAPYPQPQNRYPYKQTLPSQNRPIPDNPLWADVWPGP